jgi:uncharacterized membrane protein
VYSSVGEASVLSAEGQANKLSQVSRLRLRRYPGKTFPNIGIGIEGRGAVAAPILVFYFSEISLSHDFLEAKLSLFEVSPMMAWLNQMQSIHGLTAQVAATVAEPGHETASGIAWLHHIENVFLYIAQVGEVVLEGVAIVCVLIGIIATAQLSLKLIKKSRRSDLPFIQVRLRFGLWLALALEFQLGADILNTTIAPSTEALIRLAVIAVIRTFLNYFLNQEIETQLELREKAITHQFHTLFVDDSSEGDTHA